LTKPVLFRKKPQVIDDFERLKINLTKFPVEKGNFIVGNEYSPVAVVIPRGNRNLIKIAVESGAAIAGHLVTANIGIEKIIANIVSNPNIRYIIIFGNWIYDKPDRRRRPEAVKKNHHCMHSRAKECNRDDFE
jgi:hypothetical protein